MVAEKRRKSQEENERHARHMAELEKQREEERARAEAKEKDKHKDSFPPYPLNSDYNSSPKPEESDKKDDDSGKQK